MSKTWVKWLIAAASLVIVGGIIFAVAMSSLNWDFYRLDTTEYEAKTFDASEYEANEIRSVELKVNSFPVTVTTGDALSLNYYEASDSEVSVTVESVVLKVNESQDYNIFTSSWFSFGKLKKKYELTVPIGMPINFSGTNGTINLTGVTTETLNVKSANADIKLTDCNIENVVISSANCDTELNGCTVKNAQINSTNLDLEIRNSNIEKLESSGTNSDVEMYDTESSEINLHATNADFTLSGITVNTLSLRGTNLDANVLIRGVREEYTVETHGRELPSAQTGTTDKKITLRGTNNSVKLRWA